MMELEAPGATEPKATIVEVEACLKTSHSNEQDASSFVDLLRATLTMKAKAGIISLQGRDWRWPLELPFCDVFEYVTLNSRTNPGPIKLTGTESFQITTFHLYEDNKELGPSFGEEEQSGMSSYKETLLPSRSLDKLWECLIFEGPIKNELLDFVETGMFFADSNISPHIISCNRMIVFYGPPGTGKTSISKALAHKLAIRLSQRYECGLLVELNAHSLMSKFFSESGKLVCQVFEKIRGILEDHHSFVVVLIDEVESLSSARKAALNGTEPSDAIRVVNALLTQLDSLHSYSNVLVLATSNLMTAIDDAFIDRADLKIHVALPSVTACYEILRSALEELMRAGIVVPWQCFLTYHSICLLGKGRENCPSVCLLEAAHLCQGFSGRTLRKLPFLAHALFVRQKRITAGGFISALKLAAERIREQTVQLHNE